MRCSRKLRAASVAVTCASLLVQPAVVKAEPPAASSARDAVQPLVSDVALGQRGVLRGQLVDSSGKPQPAARVDVRRFDGQAATATTDRDGRFALEGLSGGVVDLSVAGNHGIYRLWAADTAPPSARSEILVVNGPTAYRGQRPLHCLLASPWVIAGIIALAVAIPVAVHNADDDESGS